MVDGGDGGEKRQNIKVTMEEFLNERRMDGWMDDSSLLVSLACFDGCESFSNRVLLSLTLSRVLVSSILPVKVVFLVYKDT